LYQAQKVQQNAPFKISHEAESAPFKISREAVTSALARCIRISQLENIMLSIHIPASPDIHTPLGGDTPHTIVGLIETPDQFDASGQFDDACYRIKEESIVFISARAPTTHAKETITSNYIRLFDRAKIPGIQHVNNHVGMHMEKDCQSVHLMWSMFLLVLLHDMESDISPYLMHSRRRSPAWRAAVPLILHLGNLEKGGAMTATT
jgi:hypothetical protein